MNIPSGAPANYWNPTEIGFNGNMIIKAGSPKKNTNCPEGGKKGVTGIIFANSLVRAES